MRVAGRFWLERRMNAACAVFGLAGWVRLQAVTHAAQRLRVDCRMERECGGRTQKAQKLRKSRKRNTKNVVWVFLASFAEFLRFLRINTGAGRRGRRGCAEDAEK